MSILSASLRERQPNVPSHMALVKNCVMKIISSQKTTLSLRRNELRDAEGDYVSHSCYNLVGYRSVVA